MKNTTINGFTLLRPLGSGGMAEVWYAENSIQKPAAVKILNEKYLQMKDVLQRFENEARLMAVLNHVNIRQVWDYGMIDNQPCILMEYLEGSDLAFRLKEKELFTDNQLLGWWNQLVVALNYAHAKGIVHRDIKPSNIFITSTGVVKLLDFGITKFPEKDDGSITQTGTRLGTTIYMSPEQVIDSKKVDFKSDLYSLAVTFYQLITGEPPYDLSKCPDYEIHKKIVTEKLNTDKLPSPWKNLLNDYLSKEKAARPLLIQVTTSNPNNLFSKGFPVLLKNKPSTKEVKLGMFSYLEFILVEGGQFILNGHSDEKTDAKQHKILTHVDDFYITKYPVLQTQWKKIMGHNPSHFKDNTLPVESVSWNDVQKFLKSVNFHLTTYMRLPTEAEWEYAAKGGSKSMGYRFSGSNVASEVAWNWENSAVKHQTGFWSQNKNEILEVKPHKAGLLRPNELGIFDMSGNVWEWCNDWFSEEVNSSIERRNPTGPEFGYHRVIRGGSFIDTAAYCKVTSRNKCLPNEKGRNLGFRLVLIP
jgi:serine/threonine protein kinase